VPAVTAAVTASGGAPLAPGRTRLKVCCIASVDEARVAVAHGADALGLVSAMPSGPGVIDDAAVAAVAARVPVPVATFLLTSRTDAPGLIAQAAAAGAGTLQLVDAVAPDALARVRGALPGVRLVQVIHVLDEASVDEAFAALPHADALLLDSGNPRLAVKELGGTGRVHDWALSRRVRDAAHAAGVPVFLAGGLRAENVGAAVAAVAPFGVDVCSGVRADGRLDPAKLAAFAAALAAADRAAGGAPAGGADGRSPAAAGAGGRLR
jgi:phosphoribosylanthranilate isomerase